MKTIQFVVSFQEELSDLVILILFVDGDVVENDIIGNLR